MVTVRPATDITTTEWLPSSGLVAFDMIDEVVASDADYITSPALGSGSPIIMGLSSSLVAGTYYISVRARKTDTTSGYIRIALLDSINTQMGVSSWQVLTIDQAVYSIPITTTGTASRIRIEVAASIGGIGPVPYSPVINTITNAGSGHFTLTWLAPSWLADGSALTNDPITGYIVYWGITPGQQQNGGSYSGSAIISSGTLTYTSATVSGTYWIAVSATNSSGESWSSPEIQVVT